MTATLRAPGVSQNFECRSGNSYQSNSNSLVLNVQNADIADMLNMGCSFSPTAVRSYYAGAPLAASAAVIVASGALTNGTPTIAAQPDVPRPLQAIVAPGAAAITAGTLTVPYTAHDGSAVTDVFSLITGSGVSLTLNTSKGVARVGTVVVAALAGGSSPTIEVGTTAAISLMGIGPVFSALGLFKEVLNGADEAPGAVSAQGAVTPTTAFNGTRTFSFGFSWNG